MMLSAARAARRVTNMPTHISLIPHANAARHISRKRDASPSSTYHNPNKRQDSQAKE